MPVVCMYVHARWGRRGAGGGDGEGVCKTWNPSQKVRCRGEGGGGGGVHEGEGVCKKFCNPSGEGVSRVRGGGEYEEGGVRKKRKGKSMPFSNHNSSPQKIEPEAAQCESGKMVPQGCRLPQLEPRRRSQPASASQGDQHWVQQQRHAGRIAEWQRSWQQLQCPTQRPAARRQSSAGPCWPKSLQIKVQAS